MDDRVKMIEGRLFALERDIAIIKATGATKTDLAKLRSELKTAIAEAKSGIIIWIVSAIVLAQVLPMLLKRIGF
ncbi:hypothetical protein [Massilia horti]|uniref:Hemolysin XhlA n=1 Tax=Massilia horti TaxID=2562153 RepID=A0A4Y9T7F2_9BURK|nr:hypothetical protein [Massilia horti]TFW34193.1 hypothetical protein E4O92_04505 [Massilia horti]